MYHNFYTNIYGTKYLNLHLIRRRNNYFVICACRVACKFILIIIK